MLVARLADMTSRALTSAPVLAVEVLSPSTRRADLGLKPDRLAAAGCPHYWVLDPIDPRIIVWELRHDACVEVADVTGEDVFETDAPCAVRFRPVDLTRRRSSDAR